MVAECHRRSQTHSCCNWCDRNCTAAHSATAPSSQKSRPLFSFVAYWPPCPSGIVPPPPLRLLPLFPIPTISSFSTPNSHTIKYPTHNSNSKHQHDPQLRINTIPSYNSFMATLTFFTPMFTAKAKATKSNSSIWFDPTADFHTYSILWNPQQIM